MDFFTALVDDRNIAAASVHFRPFCADALSDEGTVEDGFVIVSALVARISVCD